MISHFFFFLPLLNNIPPIFSFAFHDNFFQGSQPILSYPILQWPNGIHSPLPPPRGHMTLAYSPSSWKSGWNKGRSEQWTVWSGCSMGKERGRACSAWTLAVPMSDAGCGETEARGDETKGEGGRNMKKKEIKWFWCGNQKRGRSLMQDTHFSTLNLPVFMLYNAEVTKFTLWYC